MPTAFNKKTKFLLESKKAPGIPGVFFKVQILPNRTRASCHPERSRKRTANAVSVDPGLAYKKIKSLLTQKF